MNIILIFRERIPFLSCAFLGISSFKEIDRDSNFHFFER